MCTCLSAVALLLWSLGSRAHGLHGRGSWTSIGRLNGCGPQAQLLHGMLDLPGPGMQPMSLHWQTGSSPSGKPCLVFCFVLFCFAECSLQVPLRTQLLGSKEFKPQGETTWELRSELSQPEHRYMLVKNLPYCVRPHSFLSPQLQFFQLRLWHYGAEVIHSIVPCLSFLQEFRNLIK